MGRLIVRRVAVLVPVLLLVSFGVFLLLVLVPGDPAVTLAGGPNATPAAIAQVRRQLHLNDPLLVQYWHWLWGVLHLNLGRSLIDQSSVAHQSIPARLPVTLSLVLAATVIAVVIGVPMGVASGMRPGSARDSATRLVSSAAIAVPNFWLAVILISLFAVRWRLFPTGFVPIQSSFRAWVRDITLPAMALGILVAAVLARQVRASLVDTLGQEYIRTAWAKGGTRRVVVWRHAMKNAALPAVTVLGLQISYLLGGAVIVEQIFSIPGLGSYILTGITNHDLPVVQGVALVFVVFQMAMSLLVDIAYGYLNPKVRVT